MKNRTKRNLLIVDDEPSIRDLLLGLFEEETDLDLSFAEDGQEALKTLQDHRPDLVLLDIMMPGVDGFQVCRRIRELYDRNSVYVVMFTGLAGSEPEEEARKAGADLYLNKPFDLGLLLDIVKKNLTANN